MKSLLYDVIGMTSDAKTSPRISVFLTDRDNLTKVQKDVAQNKIPEAEVVHGGLERALKQFKEKKSPPVIVVDISGVELPISGLKELQEICSKSTRFIVVGDVDRVSLYRDLIGFGAVEYLIKPIPLKLLRTTISQAFGEPENRHRRDISARNIAIVGVAGGIGATSIASSLGDVLAAKLKRKTLLLDCQINSPAVCTHFNRKVSNGLGALCSDPTRLDKLLISRNVEKINERLDLLCIDGINEPSVAPLSKNIAVLYPLISESYHYILSDIGYGALKELVSNATHFTSVVFVSDMRLSSLVNLQRMVKAFLLKKQSTEVLIVLNQSRGSKTLEISANQVKKFLSTSPDAYLRYDPKSFSKSTLKGIPIGRVPGNFQKDIAVVADLLTHHPNSKDAPLWDAIRRRS